ncbi:xanthine dehydrogenase family protein molybdopterin-binding subunit, partial [Acinetobacter baumannii]
HDAVHPLLAADRVRYAGQPVAFVVAESLVDARDAAEAIMVDYADLPAVGTMPAALADGAPLVWDDAPGNIAFDWETGDKAKVDELF